MAWEFDKNKFTPEIIKKHGRPLFNKEDLEIALNEETFLKQGSPKADQTHYQQLGFQCMCRADMHAMNGDFRTNLVLSASDEKFLYKCTAMGIYVFFQVKAKWLVNHYCSPIWFVDGDLFDKHAGEILKKHKNYKDLK